VSDRVFVAHNVNFDYSFVRHELERAGLKWTAKKLCTVRAARKIRPGLLSYSLGRLCDSLNINQTTATVRVVMPMLLLSYFLDYLNGIPIRRWINDQKNSI
jgi:DNA polymerase III epsilon subunit-like protein